MIAPEIDESRRRRTYSLKVETCIKIDKVAIMTYSDKSDIVDCAIEFFCEAVMKKTLVEGISYVEAMKQMRGKNNDR